MLEKLQPVLPLPCLGVAAKMLVAKCPEQSSYRNVRKAAGGRSRLELSAGEHCRQQDQTSHKQPAHAQRSTWCLGKPAWLLKLLEQNALSFHPQPFTQGECFHPRAGSRRQTEQAAFTVLFWVLLHRGANRSKRLILQASIARGRSQQATWGQ